MATRNTVIEALARAIATAPRLSSLREVFTYVPNLQLEESGNPPPFVGLSVVANPQTDENTDALAGYTRDDDGRKTGRIWQRSYRMEVQADIYTNQGDGNDPNALADALETALRRYDRAERGESFEDEDGNAISSIRNVSYLGGRRADDLTTSPTVRRWRSTIEVRYFDRTREAEEYGPQPRIRFVNYPHPGDFEGAVGDDVDVEYVAAEHPENTT